MDIACLRLKWWPPVVRAIFLALLPIAGQHGLLDLLVSTIREKETCSQGEEANYRDIYTGWTKKIFLGILKPCI
jgi:hypothetical protein